MHVYVFSIGAVGDEELKSLEYLKKPTQITYVQMPPLESSRHPVSSLEGVLAQNERIDVLYISNSSKSDEDQLETQNPSLNTLVEMSNHVLAVGNGRLALLTTKVPDNSQISGHGMEHPSKTFTKIRFIDATIARWGKYWTASSSPENLIALVKIFNFESCLPFDYPYPPFPSGDDTDTDNPGERVSKAIAVASSDTEVIETTFYFAYRLAVEGFVDSCSDLVLSLLQHFPNDKSIPEHAQWLEVFWLKTNRRPQLPWEGPTYDTILEKDRERRLDPSHWHPNADEIEMTLDATDCRLKQCDDPHHRPYPLSIAICLAIEHGDLEKAERWIKRIVELAIKYDTMSSWMYDLGLWPTMHDIFLSRYVARVNNRVIEDAKKDVEIITDGLETRRTKQASRKTRRVTESGKDESLSWDTLISKLERFKYEDHASIKKNPVSNSAIEEAEMRLGVTLPEDYKEFLKVSNGLEFLPNINRPGLLPIEKLEWQNTADLGLDELQIDLGMQLDPHEYEKIPNMTRVLVISDEGEELLWYIEPSLVRRSLESVKESRGLADLPEEPSWRLVFWVHWLPEMKWHESFRGYLGGLITKE